MMASRIFDDYKDTVNHTIKYDLIISKMPNLEYLEYGGSCKTDTFPSLDFIKVGADLYKHIEIIHNPLACFKYIPNSDVLVIDEQDYTGPFNRISQYFEIPGTGEIYYKGYDIICVFVAYLGRLKNVPVTIISKSNNEYTERAKMFGATVSTIIPITGFQIAKSRVLACYAEHIFEDYKLDFTSTYFTNIYEFKLPGCNVVHVNTEKQSIIKKAQSCSTKAVIVYFEMKELHNPPNIMEEYMKYLVSCKIPLELQEHFRKYDLFENQHYMLHLIDNQKIKTLVANYKSIILNGITYIPTFERGRLKFGKYSLKIDKESYQDLLLHYNLEEFLIMTFRNHYRFLI